MRALVVSDVHLGIPAPVPGSRAKLFELLQQRWDTVIFLGDLFDLWLMSYEEIKEKNRELVQSIAQLPCDVIYVPGNHDDVFCGVDHLDGMHVVKQPYAFADVGKRIVLFHGDAYDAFGKLGWFQRKITYLISLGDRLLQWLVGPGTSVTRIIRRSAANSGRADTYSERVAQGAVSDAQGADVVVAGHTHMPTAPRVIGISHYVNAGDFGPEHMTYVVIEDGVPTFHDAATESA